MPGRVAAKKVNAWRHQESLLPYMERRRYLDALHRAADVLETARVASAGVVRWMEKDRR